jgi:hypothetical protein
MLLRSRTLRLLLTFAAATGAMGSSAALDGCSSDDATPGAADGATGSDTARPGDDAASEGDAAVADAASDARTDAGGDGGNEGKGETCIGFAKGTPCGANGFGDYGYVCFGGSPPGIVGCKLASSTGSFGDTYCCTENKCVAQPDQDKECKAKAGTPHRFQCPPDGDAGPVAAPAGCVSAGGGGSAVENFYCCP